MEPEEPHDNDFSISSNALFEAELKIFIEDIKNLLNTRSQLRKLYNVNKGTDTKTHRIILPSVGDKDTDAYVCSEILKDGMNLFLKGKCAKERLFIGGDQKTMDLALRLKRQYPHFKQIYITIPDLHFRKSLMHAILTAYEHLGLQHLAKLCGYNNNNHWDYLRNTCSLHKSFEFLERLSESMRLALTYEFITSLLQEGKSSMNELIQRENKEKSLNNDLLQLYQTFILENSRDEIFQKNIDLLNAVENIIAHYTAERSRNWHLRTASLKDSIHFAMVNNCTQYGPLLIELLFHQLHQQQRYIDLMQDGFFSNNLRNSENSVFVGNDTLIEDVNLLAGQFRHKRQTVDQAIAQSSSIDILQSQVDNINKNLGIKSSFFEPHFKDDRETKLRLVRAMINFGSFKNKSRKLANEFCINDKVYNLEILKINWYPVADYMIRRYVQQNKCLQICSIESASYPDTVVTHVSELLMKRVLKSSSVVIKIFYKENH